MDIDNAEQGDDILLESKRLLLHTATPESVLKFLNLIKNDKSGTFSKEEIEWIQDEYFEPSNRDIVPILKEFTNTSAQAGAILASRRLDGDDIHDDMEDQPSSKDKLKNQDNATKNLQLTTF